MKRRQVILAGAGVALVSVGLGWTMRWHAERPQPAQAELGVGGPPVDIWPLRFERPQGGELVLAHLRGRPLVLNFWATWCPPCVAEMPEFVKFYNETARDKVAFISLNANDASEIRSAVTTFQKANALPFPIQVFNDNGGVEALAKATGAPLTGGLPTTLIYDREGKLIATWERSVTLEELNAAIKPLL